MQQLQLPLQLLTKRLRPAAAAAAAAEAEEAAAAGRRSSSSNEPLQLSNRRAAAAAVPAYTPQRVEARGQYPAVRYISFSF